MGKDDPTSSRPGISTTNPGFFSNLIQCRLSYHFDEAAVAELETQIEGRIGRAGYLFLDGTRMERLTRDGQSALEKLLLRFRLSGGEELIFHSKNKILNMVITNTGLRAGLRTTVVTSIQEYSNVLKRIDPFK